MREIKFRALDNGGVMRHGYLCHWASQLCIQEITEYGPTQEEPCGGAHTQYYPIRRDTVGEFTGLKDRSGIEIYEGDIVESGPHTRRAVEFKTMTEHEGCGHGGSGQSCIVGFEIASSWWSDAQRLIVLGNIHEHPHLLTEGVKA